MLPGFSLCAMTSVITGINNTVQVAYVAVLLGFLFGILWLIYSRWCFSRRFLPSTVCFATLLVILILCLDFQCSDPVGVIFFF